MNTLIVILSVLFMDLALWSLYTSRGWSAAAAFAGYFTSSWLDGRPAADAMIFWGIAAAIVWGIAAMLPPAVSRGRSGVAYIASAALAGGLVGLIMSGAGLIIGSAAGAFLGALAFSRTPAGREWSALPSSSFLRLLCAKGLPAVVTSCMVAMTALHIIYRFE